jgi:phosphatidylglycerol---prolipoprotein diacylglyceryl transferase
MTGHLTPLLADIPAPPFRELEIGPLNLRMYGLMIALGVLAAVWIAQRRWQARGHDPADIASMAMWAVPAGIVGARAYHVATDWELFRGRWEHALYIWEGGLGIPGAIAAGVLAGYIYARVNHLPLPELFDAVAPALPVAQAIGRWGNYFNQELFGRPTDLPWGLEVDLADRPAGYSQFTAFHPTFLYESLWNLGVAALIVFVIERYLKLRPGRLFAVYVLGYGIGRLWVESLRIDPASKLAGLRVNTWMSIVLIVGSLSFLLSDRFRKPAPPAAAEDESKSADETEVESKAEVDAETADVDDEAETESEADEAEAADESEAGTADETADVDADANDEPTTDSDGPGETGAEPESGGDAETESAGAEPESEEIEEPDADEVVAEADGDESGPEAAVTPEEQGEDAEHGERDATSSQQPG